MLQTAEKSNKNETLEEIEKIKNKSAKKWVVKNTAKSESKINKELLTKIASKYQLHPIALNLLIDRAGKIESDINHFIAPPMALLKDPFLLKGMTEAAKAVTRAIIENKRLLIVGDYDVDGATSSALMNSFFKDVQYSNFEYFIPSRFKHGYGLTHASLEVVFAKKPDIVLTVDNGATAKEEVKLLQQAGIEVVVTDHHLCSEETLPDCIVVNPNQVGCTYEFKGLSGCAVAFKLIMAVRKILRENDYFNSLNGKKEPNIKNYLDLVALATIGDMMPLQGENRLFVMEGLKLINRSPRPSFEVLANNNGHLGVVSKDLGFGFAPLINSAGRMEDASIAVEFLTAADVSDASQAFKQIDTINQGRKEKTKQMVAEALANVNENEVMIVTSSKNFHEGIIGLLAIKLLEKYKKPVVVFSEFETSYKGSARSIDGVNIKALFDDVKEHITRYGGHKGAAGLVVQKENFEAFKTALLKAAEIRCAHVERPVLEIEAKLELNEITPKLVNDVLKLEPYGKGNPLPLFQIEAPNQCYQIIGADHIKWNLGNQLEIIGWGYKSAFNEQKPKTLAVSLGFNVFRGVRKVQMLVEDVIYW